MNSSQLCVLCGINAATKGKGDHLPPQSLYPKPRKPNVTLNTVPACISCNGSGSKDDEMFKMIIGLSTGEYRVDAQQIIDSLARTIGKNRKIARRLLERSQRVYARRHGGLYQPMIAIPFSKEAYSRVVSRIVRGLYWQRTGKILGDATISVSHGDEPEGRVVEEIKKLLRTENPTVLNGGTFSYKVFFDEAGSFWAMQFFGSHTVFALVSSTPDTTSAARTP